MNPVRNLVRAALHKDGEPYNILMCGFDGYFETMMTLTGNNIFVLPNLSRFEWPINVPPKNKMCNILPSMDSMPIDLEIDFVLCNDRTIQYDATFKLSQMMHVPHICVEHFSSFNRYNPTNIKQAQLYQKFNSHVSIAQSITKDWDNSTTIQYGLEQVETQPKDNTILMVGEYNNMDTQILRQILQNIPNIKVVGKNAGISNNPKHQSEIDNLLAKTSIYINLSTDGRIPNHLLRAMNNECAIISNSLPIYNDILNNGNAILCTSVPQFIQAVATLQKDENRRKQLAAAAKQTIIKSWNSDNMKTKWNELLNTLIKTRFIR